MSSRFKFRLEKVLSFREDNEKTAHRSFVSAQTSLHQSQEELALLKGELSDVCIQATTEVTGFDVNNRLNHSLYAHYLTGCIIHQEKTVQEKEDEVLKERFHLEAKVKERKILSRLKEKGSHDYIQKGNLAEQKQNDEFATNCFYRI